MREPASFQGIGQPSLKWGFSDHTYVYGKSNTVGADLDREKKLDWLPLLTREWGEMGWEAAFP